MQIAILTIVSIVVLALLVALTAQHAFFRGMPFMDVVRIPMISVVAQLLAYLVVLAFMVLVVKRVPERPFWRSIRWNWPGSMWGLYVIVGATLFRSARSWAVAANPQTSAYRPIFLYRARGCVSLDHLGDHRTIDGGTVFSRFSVSGAGPTPGRWRGHRSYGCAIRDSPLGAARILMGGGNYFFAGLALTIVRAVTKSVAASFLTHVGYNGTLSELLLFIATNGFRHLDKLTQQ